MKRLEDVDGLHNILGNVMLHFMEEKPTPYLTNALQSKDDFWRVPVYKRAMTFVFLVRYVLGYNSQIQWKKFSEVDYKLNTRCFKRWVAKDESIFLASSEFEKLPDHPPPTNSKSKSRKTKRGSSAVSLSFDSPMKRKYVVGDTSTDDEDED